MLFGRLRNIKRKRIVTLAVFGVLLFALSGSVLTSRYKEADAFFGCVITIPCQNCIIIDTFVTTEFVLELFQTIFDGIIEDNITDHLNSEENWIVEDFFADFLFEGLAELTEYLSLTAMYQVEMVGTLFDAKIQLETQRLFFQLEAEAHNNYQPSEEFCAFGTGTRSLAATESLARLNVLALSRRSMTRQLGTKDSISASNTNSDKRARWDQFVNTYCDPKDNGWIGNLTGLEQACDHDGAGTGTLSGAEELYRVNRDIDYTRLIDAPRTLSINFSDDTLTDPDPLPALPTSLPDSFPEQERRHDEEDVLALAANLYGHESLTRRLSLSDLNYATPRKHYSDLRTVIAKRAVAEHSFNSIVAMKSQGSAGMLGSGGGETGAYLAAIVRELLPDTAPEEEIIALIGENPSQYAQLEILSKTIYQNPRFFANLYVSPANVERMSAAMKAVELMLDRALFESELRQEMIMSVMLSGKLEERRKAVNTGLIKEKDQ